MPAELPTLFFENAQEWRAWLEEHHTQTDGILIKFFKKNSGVTSLTYPEAVDEALCFGWIDGQANKLDENSYVQRFTPRRSRSMWSKINVGKFARLKQEGKMTPAGQRAYDAAKADGRLEQAYDSPKTARQSEDFLIELRAHPKADAFFKTLSKQEAYSVYFRIQSAKKPETRANRIKMFVAMFEKGQKFF